MTAQQREILRQYEATRRIVNITRHRDGSTTVSLNGGRRTSVEEAVAKDRECLDE